MNLLNKLTIQNLKLNKKRTIVTIVGIMLSVALITAVASVYASGLQSLIDYETSNKGAFHAVFYDMPLEEIKTLENNRGIDTISLTESLGYADIGSKNKNKPYVCIQAFTKNALENLSVKLVDGRLPENGSEILIPAHLKTSGRVALAVGDEVTLDVGKRAASDGYELNQQNPFQWADGEEVPAEYLAETVSKTYKITGLIERPAATVEPFSAPGYTVITYVDESALSGNVDVYVRFTKSGVKNAEKLTAGILGADEELFAKAYRKEPLTDEETERLAESLGGRSFDFNYYMITLETDTLGISTVDTLEFVAAIVIAIIVITSIFCIKNSFDISITERIRQYGMLRSIGATRKQIRKNVFFEASILGAFGIPLGILLGFLASFILVIVSNVFLAGFGFTLSFVFSWPAVAAAVLLGIVTIYFSAFRSAVRAARVSPLDAIRSSANIKAAAKKLNCPKIIKKIFGVGGEISYKNLKRSRSKYRTTVISIAVSVIVFISLSAFMSMAMDEAEREINRTEYNIKLFASYTDANEYRILTDTTSFDNIQTCSVVRTAEIEFQGDHYSREYADWFQPANDGRPQTIGLAAVGNAQFADFCTSLGLDPEEMNDKAILCDYNNVEYDESGSRTGRYMRVYDFKKGDTVTGSTGDGVTEDRISIRAEIAAVSERRPFGMKNWNRPYLIVSDESFDSMAEASWAEIYYKTSDADKLQDEIEAHLQDKTYALVNSDQNYREMNNLFTLIGIFLYGFIIVISLIGITNIFNTITTNMELRKPEFAMLRSVGMTNREFNRMIRLESLFMGTRALLFGVPAGILLSYAIYHFLAEESGYPFKLPVLSILISAAAVFVLISLIMAYSMGKIRKQNIIETIRNEVI